MQKFSTSLFPGSNLSRLIIFRELSNQQDLIDMYRTFDPTAAGNIFFSNVHGPYNEIYQKHGHKINLKIFKRIEITWRIVSDHSGIKLEINS